MRSQTLATRRRAGLRGARSLRVTRSRYSWTFALTGNSAHEWQVKKRTKGCED